MYENKTQIWDKIGKIRFWRLNKKVITKTAVPLILRTDFNNNHNLRTEQILYSVKFNR